MSTALYIAAFLAVGIGVAHSWLGERYILIRLFRQGNLPRLFGGTDFTRNTLRFAWHITTLAWVGFAAILIAMADGALSTRTVGLIVGATFGSHFIVALVASRGRHYSWVVFLAIAVLAVVASGEGTQ